MNEKTLNLEKTTSSVLSVLLIKLWTAGSQLGKSKLGSAIGFMQILGVHINKNDK